MRRSIRSSYEVQRNADAGGRVDHHDLAGVSRRRRGQPPRDSAVRGAGDLRVAHRDRHRRAHSEVPANPRAAGLGGAGRRDVRGAQGHRGREAPTKTPRWLAPEKPERRPSSGRSSTLRLDTPTPCRRIVTDAPQADRAGTRDRHPCEPPTELARCLAMRNRAGAALRHSRKVQRTTQLPALTARRVGEREQDDRDEQRREPNLDRSSKSRNQTAPVSHRARTTPQCRDGSIDPSVLETDLDSNA